MRFSPFLLVVLATGALASSVTTTCVVPSNYESSNGTASDSEAIAAAFAECSENATIEFSEGVNYNVFEPVSATNLSNVVISLKGNWNLPQNISYVQNLVSARGGTLYWFSFKGTNIQFVGTPNRSLLKWTELTTGKITTGWVKSYGQAWWDANPANNTGIALRPHLMSFNAGNSVIQHFKSLKPIAWNVNLKGTNITVSDTIIEATSSTESFPFNTDGFDVGGTDITILNSVIYNGDDAIAVGSGSHNILFSGGTVGYQTHGMSIGSLGKDSTSFANVTDVRFEDITVVNGVYAARFKSWLGGNGLVKNVSWSNIRLYNVTFPIYVTQTYSDQASTSSGAASNQSVNMVDFTWENFTGTINSFNPGDGSCVTDPCWYNVGLPNLKHTESIIVECATTTSCQNFAFKNIEVFPQTLEPPTMICIDATESLNPDLGTYCRNGTFIPLA
ncbi:Exopolygalacturonase C [Cytospora mali]|uniref:galacturonan 1,4-alpha-galacturonidase n=1 Tax=Cytospora mali TaxID=578113 RepID=A0A194W6Y1_CYTMA|nr:Exopolygalacturonase C [Valsa mali]